MTIELPQRVRVVGEVLVEHVDDEAVLLDLDAGAYFGLNTVAAACWQEFALHGSVPQARARLLERFDVEPERLDRHLSELIEQLAERGLIEVESDG